MERPTPLRLTPPAATQVSLPSRLREGLGVGKLPLRRTTIFYFPPSRLAFQKPISDQNW
jgi:hypothetical protein